MKAKQIETNSTYGIVVSKYKLEAKFQYQILFLKTLHALQH